MGADLAEAFAKRGGLVYMPPDRNRLTLAYDLTVVTPGQSQGLLIPCLAMDKVPEDVQPNCVTIVNPTAPKVTIRKYGEFLENDLDYDPRNPETFEEDASFIVRGDWFFPGFYTAESVSMPDHMWMVGEEEITVSAIQDSEEYRFLASFAVVDHSTWSKSASLTFSAA